MEALYRIADRWVGHKRGEPARVAAARAAVAHLKPIVVVTGGSRGIGAALAQRFASAGFDVALVARDAHALAAAAKNIEARTGRRAIAIPQDITAHDAAHLLEAALSAQGFYAAVLANNAAIGLSGAFAEADPAEVSRLIALNVEAATRLMHHFLKPMLERRDGGILNVASLGGVVPGAYQAAYYASKAFLISLTEAVATENSGRGVRIAVFVPGPVNTAFHAEMGANGALYRHLIPSLSPQSAANAAFTGYMLGQRIIVSGIAGGVAYAALRFLPHPLSAPLFEWLLKPPKTTR